MSRLSELLQPFAANSEPGTQVVLVLAGMIGLIVAASIALALALLIWRAIVRLRPAAGVADPAPGLLRGVAAIVLAAVLVLAAVGGVLVVWSRLAPKPEAAPPAVASAPAPAAKPAPAAAPASAKAETRNDEMPAFAAGENYAAVREKLIARGWQPVRAPDAAPCPENDRRCKGRPEALSCSNTGLAACEFVWQQGGNLLRVYTTGETPVYKGSAMMTTTAQRPAAAAEEPAPRDPAAGPADAAPSGAQPKP